jgi:hypothetical protein
MASTQGSQFEALDDPERLAAVILDMITYVAPQRIERARRGKLRGQGATIPWEYVVAAVDEVERQYPGVVARFQTSTEPDRQRRRGR